MAGSVSARLGCAFRNLDGWNLRAEAATQSQMQPSVDSGPFQIMCPTGTGGFIDLQLRVWMVLCRHVSVAKKKRGHLQRVSVDRDLSSLGPCSPYWECWQDSWWELQVLTASLGQFPGEFTLILEACLHPQDPGTGRGGW